MQNLRLGRTIAALVVLVILCGIALRFYKQDQSGNAIEPKAPQREARAERSPVPSRSQLPEASEVQTDGTEPPSVDFDYRLVLLGSNLPPRLPREQVERYVEQQRRSAASLLAAFHALDDTNYLAEAATNFPNDPRVQWTVLARNTFPEERRKWLDLFKASSPDNSLANYLSAENYFDKRYYEPANEYRFGENNLTAREFLQSGQADAAINELVEATSKPLFKDYTLESKLDQEDLNLSAGRSQVQARLSAYGSSEDLTSELANFKSIAITLQELQKDYLSAADSASAQYLTEMGLTLAERLRSGERGKLIINQLVGTASEAILLKSWDANVSCEFLNGQTPQQRLDDLKEQRTSIRSMAASAHELVTNLTEAELLNYLDRSRLFGEVGAVRWRNNATVHQRPKTRRNDEKAGAAGASGGHWCCHVGKVRKNDLGCFLGSIRVATATALQKGGRRSEPCSVEFVPLKNGYSTGN
jgi:hypothetical protein